MTSHEIIKTVRLLFVCFFIIISNNLQAQEEGLSNYYNNIYAAENCIMRNTLDSGVAWYKLAFKHKSAPFSKDVYNAAVVSSKAKARIFGFQNLKILVQRGISFEELANTVVFERFFKDGKNRSLIKKLRHIKTTFDSAYRNDMQFLLDRDQYYRIMSNGYSLHRDSILKTDAANISAFKGFVNLRGFPTDERLGCKNLSALETPLFSAIILHQAAGPWQQFNLSHFIEENILNGNLENKVGFFFINRMNGSSMPDILKYNYVKVVDSTKSSSNPKNIIILNSTSYGYLPLTDAELNKKNIQRAILYLEDYGSSQKKVLFCMMFPEFRFNSLGSTANANYTNKEAFDSDKKLLKLF